MMSDESATVDQIAMDVSVIVDHEAIAAKHGTTVEHVRQAIEYAVKSGLTGV